MGATLEGILRTNIGEFKPKDSERRKQRNRQPEQSSVFRRCCRQKTWEQLPGK
jgi:hypothetical protein